MSEPIIKVRNVSKRYRIGAKEEGYKTFREAIMDGITAPIRNLTRLRKLTKFDDDSAERRAPCAIPLTLCPMRKAQCSHRKKTLSGR
jgi:hypothetical protein